MTTKRLLSFVMALALVLSLLVVPTFATTETQLGDLDGNGTVNSDDVVALLLYLTMPDQFPLEAHKEFTGDSKVDTDDAIQLLLFCTMPDLFPLNPPSGEPEATEPEATTEATEPEATTEATEPSEEPAPLTPVEIVYAAYSLEVGESLEGTYTLTGEISKVVTAYNATYGNVTVDIIVEGMVNNAIRCYRLAGEGADQIAKGDIVTVTGTLTNYNGNVQFAQGCTLDAWEDNSAEVVLPETPAEIVYAAYSLDVNEALPGTYTLTGTITEIPSAYSEQYGNLNAVIVVEGMEDFPILCYRLKGEGADQIAVGDIITVTGSLKNYNGTVEFDSGCTLDAWERPETPTEPTEPEAETSGSIEIPAYSGEDWTAPQDGFVKFTINVEGAGLAVLNGYTPIKEGTGSVTVAVTAGNTYGVYPQSLDVACVVTWEYVEGDDVGGETESIPSGSALALGDNNVTLTYATRPAMAPYWTYTATETGYLTVTVTNINGQTNLGMAFGRGMYTLLVGETDGAFTNTATVFMAAGETVNVAVLDTMDMSEVPAVLNLTFAAGNPEEPTVPGGEPDGTAQNPYVIEAVPYTIEFYGGMDAYYIYTASEAGNVVVTALEGAYLSFLNGEYWEEDAAGNYVIPVEAGYTLLLNPWTMRAEFEGQMTVSFVAGGTVEPTEPSETEPTETEPSVPGGPNGTMDNPYIIEAMPFTINFYGGMDEYYTFTAPEAGSVMVTALQGAYMSLLNGEYWEEDGAGNYVIPVEAGYTLLLNPWTMEPAFEGQMTVTFYVAGDEIPTVPTEATEPTEEEPTVPGGLEGSIDNPYVIDSLPYTIYFYGGMDEYYSFTATEAGRVVVTPLEGAMLSLPYGENWEFDENGNYVIPVIADYELVMNAWTMEPELLGEMVVTFIAGGIDEPTVPTDPQPTTPGSNEGTAENPFVIEALPYTIQFYGGMDAYYIYTATEAGNVVVTALEGAYLTLLNGEYWEEDAAGNYVIPVEAGYTLLLNPWTMLPALDGAMEVSFVAGGAEEPTEPSTPVESGYIQITSLEELVSGEYVMIVNSGYAPGAYDNGWLTAVQPVVEGNKVTDTQGAVWTLTVTDAGVSLKDANGVEVAPKGGNNNGIKNAAYTWAVTFTDGTFRFAGVGSDTVILASNTSTGTNGGFNRFRGYKSTTVTGQYADSYPADFTLFKLVGEDTPVVPSEPTEPTTPPETEPAVTEPAADSTLSIVDAAALGASKEHNNYTAGKYYVSGVITNIANTTYGNLYIADAEGNTLYVYGVYNEDGSTRFDKMNPQPAVGDTVTFYGILGQYNGTAQMKNGWVVAMDAAETEPTTPDTEPTTPPETEPTEPAYATAPVVGQAYKFMLTQKNLGKELYITGAMDSYYYGTTEDASVAVTVYFEEAEGGYRVYFLNNGVKTYMEMVLNGTYKNVVFTTEPTKVLKWNAEIASVTCDLDGTEYYFGTYGTYKTFSASTVSRVTGNNASTMDVSNFVGHFYEVEEEVKSSLTWQEYVAMTGAEQKAYKESFENSADYYAWLEDAQAKYDAEHESYMDGTINMGDLVNKG